MCSPAVPFRAAFTGNRYSLRSFFPLRKHVLVYHCKQAAKTGGLTSFQVNAHSMIRLASTSSTLQLPGNGQRRFYLRLGFCLAPMAL